MGLWEGKIEDRSLPGFLRYSSTRKSSAVKLNSIRHIQSRVVLRFWSTVREQEWFGGCPCWVSEVQTRRRRVAGGTRRIRGCTAAWQKHNGMWWRSRWCSPRPGKHRTRDNEYSAVQAMHFLSVLIHYISVSAAVARIYFSGEGRSYLPFPLFSLPT